MASTQSVTVNSVSSQQTANLSSAKQVLPQTSKGGVDQISKSGEEQRTKGMSLLDDPLANLNSGGSGGGLFSGIDFFEPGIAEISLEMTEVLAKSSMMLMGADGYLRGQEINDFLDQNQDYAEDDMRSTEWQAAGALLMGVVGLVSCGATFIKLGFDCSGDKETQGKIDDLNKQIQANTDQLTNPTMQVESSEELDTKAANNVEQAVPSEETKADPAADLDVTVDTEEKEVQEKAPTDSTTTTNEADQQALRDENKQLKSQLTAETNKSSSYWGKKNIQNQGMQAGINALGQLGKGGCDAVQGHYAYLRDMSGGLKQTDQQLYDAINSTFSQTTQFVSQAIQQAMQNFSTVASMALQLA